MYLLSLSLFMQVGIDIRLRFSVTQAINISIIHFKENLMVQLFKKGMWLVSDIDIDLERFSLHGTGVDLMMHVLGYVGICSQPLVQMDHVKSMSIWGKWVNKSARERPFSV